MGALLLYFRIFSWTRYQGRHPFLTFNRAFVTINNAETIEIEVCHSDLAGPEIIVTSFFPMLHICGRQRSEV